MNRNYEIVIQMPAQMDFDEAFTWYEQNNTGQELKLVKDFDQTLRKIIRNPFYASLVYEHFRSASLSVFPYEIIYFVDIESDKIIITVFNHFKRKPNWHHKR